MSDSPAARPLVDRAPADPARNRVTKRHVGALFTLASALAVGFALMAPPPPAHAVTNLDDHWVVVHGGTGQLSLNPDGTYTSTCEVTPGYGDAFCPASAGTFERNSMGSSHVSFHGDDGSTTSYRYSGPVAKPDVIKSTFTSRNFSPLVMMRGDYFTCTTWSDYGFRFKNSPLVDYDATSNLMYATGSHDPLSPDGYVNLIETAPNYFQSGVTCPPPAPQSIMHIDSARDTSYPASVPGRWVPQATVTVKDLTGAPISGAEVRGYFNDGDKRLFSELTDCITGDDGSCSMGEYSVEDSVESLFFQAFSPKKLGLHWDEQSVDIVINRPHTSTPTPTPTPTLTTAPTPTPTLTTAPTPTSTPTLTTAPTTHHVGDLDSVTTAASSLRKWEPKVAVTVLSSTGKTVAGATVSGTVSHRKGTLTCTTADSGTCVLGNFSLSRYTRSTVFTVTDVTNAASRYAPKANTDPDGDSNGTTITVRRP